MKLYKTNFYRTAFRLFSFTAEPNKSESPSALHECRP